MKDILLEDWRHSEARRLNVTLPHFDPEARHDAPILALLETPVRSGATKSGMVSLNNDDPTARFQRQASAEAGIAQRDILCWNIWAAYDEPVRMATAALWAAHVQRLIDIMTGLQVVLVFGGRPWTAAQRLNLDDVGPLIGAPHPSTRGRMAPDAADRIREAWRRARRIVQGRH